MPVLASLLISTGVHGLLGALFDGFGEFSGRQIIGALLFRGVMTTIIALPWLFVAPCALSYERQPVAVVFSCTAAAICVWSGFARYNASTDTAAFVFPMAWLALWPVLFLSMLAKRPSLA